MENKLIVSLSPHVHGGDSVQKNMYGVLIALIPAFLVSLYFFGLGALIVTATSVTALPSSQVCCWHSTYRLISLSGLSFWVHCLLSV